MLEAKLQFSDQIIFGKIEMNPSNSYQCNPCMFTSSTRGMHVQKPNDCESWVLLKILSKLLNPSMKSSISRLKTKKKLEVKCDAHQVSTKTFWNLLLLRTIMTPVPNRCKFFKNVLVFILF